MLASYESAPPGTVHDLASYLGGAGAVIDGVTHSFAGITLLELRRSATMALGQAEYYVHLDVGAGKRISKAGNLMDKTGEEWGPHESTIDVYTERGGTSHLVLRDMSPFTPDGRGLAWLESARSHVRSQFDTRSYDRAKRVEERKQNIIPVVVIGLVVLAIVAVVYFSATRP